MKTEQLTITFDADPFLQRVQCWHNWAVWYLPRKGILLGWRFNEHVTAALMLIYRKEQP